MHKTILTILTLTLLAGGVSCSESETPTPKGDPQTKSSPANQSITNQDTGPNTSPSEKIFASADSNSTTNTSPLPPIPTTTPETAKLAPPQLLTREQFEAGWISLFDGRTLFGWKPNSGTNWSVQNGVITSVSDEPGMLMTNIQLSDYELDCQVRLEQGGNSGIFLRSAFEPKNPASDCFELNICDSHPEFPTGSIVARKKPDLKLNVEGRWTSLHIVVNGQRIQAEFDGKTVIKFTDVDRKGPTIGHIGLQANGGKVEFRNIRLKPLGADPVFNGKDLTGWQEVPGSKSRFTVVDGMIHVTNGRGFLETERTWKDFILQADVRTNGKHLNSGFFFRALPGTEKAPSHGYEYQIQNAFKDGDRTNPADFGTGAIFRRVKARWIVADDNQWFTTTLIAHGPHFATWVNGYQVVDWTDFRKPHENPRRGTKLEAGHISLQGHDPTTDLDFRKLRIVTISD